MTRPVKLLLLSLLILPLVLYGVFRRAPDRSHPLGVPDRAPRAVHWPWMPATQPQIALIFDDLGFNLRDLGGIASLNIPLTVSVLPGLASSEKSARIASELGFSVMLHLPMEPKHPERFHGRIQLLSASMDEAEKVRLLREYLSQIQPAIGVNNHMGSLATEDAALMRLVMQEVKRRGLFFIDSRTSLDSVACRIATEEGVRCGENGGFVDSVLDEAEIERHIQRLVNAANSSGRLIVIAHPHAQTIRVLRAKLPEHAKDIRFVTIREYFGNR